MEFVHRPGKDHVNADGMSSYRIHWCIVTTIPMAVTFRTCHAVAANTVYGRMNRGIGFTMKWMTSSHLLSGIFPMTRVILNHRKMSPGWTSMMAESDAYMVGERRATNHPWAVRTVLKRVAAIKEVPLPIMRKICESSFRRLFMRAK